MTRTLQWALVLALAGVILLVVLWSRASTPAPVSEPIPQPWRARVGFWNVRDLSGASRDATELATIARLMGEFDVLAVAEIEDPEVLGQLTGLLGTTGWAMAQTPKEVGNNRHTAERYGLVYRSDRWALAGEPWVMPERMCEWEDGTRVPFDREPWVVPLATLDGRFDCTLMVTHVTWGSSVKARRSEVEVLASYFGDVLSMGSDRDLILVGDFNRDAYDASFEPLLAFPSMVDALAGYGPTKVDSAHSYDHILFQTRYLTEFTGEAGVLRFDETLFAGDKEIASRIVSDHRPVWIELEIPAADDD